MNRVLTESGQSHEHLSVRARRFAELPVVANSTPQESPSLALDQQIVPSHSVHLRAICPRSLESMMTITGWGQIMQAVHALCLIEQAAISWTAQAAPFSTDGRGNTR